ncbi:MAG: hypothetical protein Kow00120_13620 [Anaerolineae bacterium]
MVNAFADEGQPQQRDCFLARVDDAKARLAVDQKHVCCGLCARDALAGDAKSHQGHGDEDQGNATVSR